MFSWGSEPPTPRIYAPGVWWATRAEGDQSWEGQQCEPWSMRIVNDGSPAPTFWSFVLGHNLSPVEQLRHWLEDTVSLETNEGWQHRQHKQDQWSEVSNYSSLMLLNLQLYNNSFEWKNWHFQGGQNILWPLLHISRGSWVLTPNPLGSTPLVSVSLVSSHLRRSDCRRRR